LRSPHYWVSITFVAFSKTGCASARGRVSKTQLTPGGTEAACQFITHYVSRITHHSRGRGRQGMHLPCKQAHVGALPTDSTNLVDGWKVDLLIDRGQSMLLTQCTAHQQSTLTPSTFQLRGTRPVYRGESHKLV